MKLDFILIILFILKYKNVFADFEKMDELFGSKSIIRKLRDEHGSFLTRTPIENSIKSVYFEEQYNFKTKDGRFQTVESNNEILIYLNDFTEFYSISDYDIDVHDHPCQAKLINEFRPQERKFKEWKHPINISIQEKLSRWSPGDTINLNSDYLMFGPSHLLFNIIDKYDEDKKSVECRQEQQDEKYIRCHVRYKYKIIMEYYFENRGELTMFPIRILTLLELQPGHHTFLTQIKYYVFEYSFNDSFVDVNLPIGYGCERFNYHNKYKSNETDFGEKFELKYEAELHYLDLKKSDKKDIFLKTKYNVRKLFMDPKISFIIFDEIDAETKENFKIYYDYEIRLAFNVYDDRCKRTLKELQNLKWIEQLNSIDLLPKFLFIYDLDDEFFKERPISYLGKHKLDDKIYSVLEQNLFNYFSIRVNVDKEDNKQPYLATVTHYYLESNRKTPKFIEVRIKNFNNKLLAIFKITINKHKLSLSSESFNREINFKRCFRILKPYPDYKLLNLSFKGDNLEFYNDDYIKYEFIRLINIKLYNNYRLSFLSPLRIHVIELIKQNNLFNIIAKLFGFDNLTIDDSKLDSIERIEINKIKEENDCARECVQDNYCFSYAFKKQEKINCQLLIFKGWENFTLSDNLELIKTKPLFNSTIAIRIITKCEREHSSIDSILKLINQLINEDQFNLVLKETDDDSGTTFYCLKNEFDLKEFNFYSLYFVLIIVIVCVIILSIILIYKLYHDWKKKKNLIKNSQIKINQVKNDEIKSSGQIRINQVKNDQIESISQIKNDQIKSISQIKNDQIKSISQIKNNQIKTNRIEHKKIKNKKIKNNKIKNKKNKINKIKRHPN